MNTPDDDLSRTSQDQWLKLYYFARTAFSAVWVAAAFTLGQNSGVIAAVLLVAYPAWDALANFVDASNSGGLARNRTQTINVAVSAATTLAVVVALGMSMNGVLSVFGLWAILSGLLQLGTAVRRWKSHGAQWAMILSGAQSALAGTFFIVQAQMPTPPSIANIAGYAAVGAFYFLVSAVWLSVSQGRRKAA
ncbi:DUF308 domain-containing protein [Labrys monachus]|uniref:Uncharacterized membrane protein HdeD (DUF308 family) n=1 Tax=Labrys monachus TaxID=217067 RepID=A0ABU0FFN6_9HYPH|nr:DUF308 domain-containing protein [Labrys monachus]MDQ0393418.1 uncharacterized membrane protein HdeD (DUF308 family) [Labrys monachus]